MGLLLIVIAILLAHRQPRLEPLFRWLPVPLWCYALPMAGVTFGWLPSDAAALARHRALATALLPAALSLLLLGVDMPSVLRSGRRAMLVAAVGASGVLLGAPLGVWLLRAHLPPEAWKGAGSLAATWTGGTMNLLSLRIMLGTPEEIFAPLVIVDAMIAYGWMALLVAASGFQRPINRWLGAAESAAPAASRAIEERPEAADGRALILCAIAALGLTLAARALAHRLPISSLVGSPEAWTILLVTTAVLGLSLIAPIRRLGAHGGRLGTPCLYLVLAATGAQAGLRALWAAPWWVVVGVVVVLVHAGTLLAAGRLLRVPLGVLATASQANIGGVVSAPMVGAIYEQSLAPLGLLLAMAFNAVGTYLGWGAAIVCRRLLSG